MLGFSALERGGRGIDDCFASSETVPFDLFIFADRFHLVFHAHFVHALRFLHFGFLSGLGDAAEDGCGAADGVGFGFGFWFFLLGDGAYLVKIAFEHCGVWDVFGGFGELEEDDAGADLEEAEDDGDDGGDGAFEALEEDG